MSDKTRQDLENAIAAHMLEEADDKSVVLSEYVVISAAQYMNPDRPYTTGYGFACTTSMSHSHLLGLIDVGTDMIKASLKDEES